MNHRYCFSRLGTPLAALALAAVVLTAPALSAPAFADHTTASAPAGATSLESLAWMAGSWSGAVDETEVEEHWTDPSGGLMLGMNRARRGGRAVMFEFLRIATRGDSIFYVALPRGRGETWFPLKELTGKRVVFENLGHDFPQRVIYWQAKPGELRARTEGMMDGKPVSEEWAWKRAKPAR